MNRKEILKAPYNPRYIDETAKRKLRENLRSRGLLRPIVVNDRTKHIVSGHQRLAIIDSLEHRMDYDIDVSLIDVDDKTEKELVIFFNNRNAQGSLDFEKLNDLRAILKLENCGFDAKDLALVIPALEAPMNAPTLEQMEDVKRTTQEIEAARVAARSAKAAANPADEADRKARIKKMREVLKKTKTSRFEREGSSSQDAELFIVAEFNDEASRQQFMIDLKLDPNERFIPGDLVMDLVVKAIGKKENPEAV
jgi:hypothetical protein